MTTTPDVPSVRKLAIATGGALLVAVLVVVGAVMPAEYGIDPIGTGRVLGLLALSQDQPSHNEHVQCLARCDPKFVNRHRVHVLAVSLDNRHR